MSRVPNSGELLAWSSIQQALSCKESSSQKKCMALLLRMMLHIPQETFERRMKGIYNSHSVDGPEAISWGLLVMSWQTPPGKDRKFFLNQKGKADTDAAQMKRVMKGWQKYGMTPFEVVHHSPPSPIARYQSEPNFRSARTGLT